MSILLPTLSARNIPDVSRWLVLYYMLTDVTNKGSKEVDSIDTTRNPKDNVDISTDTRHHEDSCRIINDCIYSRQLLEQLE